jgi:hypothetical protein
MRKKAKRPVEPGQRFRALDFDLVWVVAEVFVDHFGLPHAKLVQEDDLWSRKTLSCEHLHDPTAFLPMDEAPASPRPSLSLFRRKRLA